jgi:hypothetical protein
VALKARSLKQQGIDQCSGFQSARSDRDAISGRWLFRLCAGRRCITGAVAPNRFWVRRIGTHVDAALPFAFERIRDVERHPADALDLNFDRLAVL